MNLIYRPIVNNLKVFCFILGRSIAALCPLNARKTIPMIRRSINIGQGNNYNSLFFCVSSILSVHISLQLQKELSKGSSALEFHVALWILSRSLSVRTTSRFTPCDTNNIAF